MQQPQAAPLSLPSLRLPLCTFTPSAGSVVGAQLQQGSWKWDPVSEPHGDGRGPAASFPASSPPSPIHCFQPKPSQVWGTETTVNCPRVSQFSHLAPASEPHCPQPSCTCLPVLCWAPPAAGAKLYPTHRLLERQGARPGRDELCRHSEKNVMGSGFLLTWFPHPPLSSQQGGLATQGEASSIYHKCDH